MKTVFDYIKDYGDKTYEEAELNEIDILIFSQMSYLILNEILPNKNSSKSLSEIREEFKLLNYTKLGIAETNAKDLINAMYNKTRYKDLIFYNYEYKTGLDYQFGALTIKLPNNTIIASIEGTDCTISGWKEDFILSYEFPTESQKLASTYLGDLIKVFGPNVIVCGHSKGGSLALASAYLLPIYKKFFLKKIYSFDGPGLKEEEFNSKKYKQIRNKLINIIPDQSLVGVILKQENTTVIKSLEKGSMQHSAVTWCVDGTKFKSSTQSTLSKNLDKAIDTWLSKYNYEERKEIIGNLFELFEKSGIEKTTDFKEIKLKKFMELASGAMNLSKETKDLVFSGLKLVIINYGSFTLENLENSVKDKIKNFLK